MNTNYRTTPGIINNISWRKNKKNWYSKARQTQRHPLTINENNYEYDPLRDKHETLHNILLKSLKYIPSFYPVHMIYMLKFKSFKQFSTFLYFYFYFLFFVSIFKPFNLY